MQAGDFLRIGCVKFLNARPLIRGWPGPVELDDPSILCRKLAAGELDAALVSSFEYLRNPIYRIVDGISIASDGAVFSVVVAYRGRFDALEEIALDPASQTSVALLRGLLRERERAPRLVEERSQEKRPDETARLLIGDKAIRFRQEHPDWEYWDLGLEWKRGTGLPFVYALWLVRPETDNAPRLADRLRHLKERNLRDLESVIAEEKEFPPEFCRSYYRDNLRFSLGDREKDGLKAFANVCAEEKLIPLRQIPLELV